MYKKITINLDKELVEYISKSFGFMKISEDYSELVENVLIYFLKPQLNFIHRQTEEEKIQELLTEPEIDIDKIDKEYNFNLSSIEGSWPGEEPVVQLVEMLSK